MDEEEDEDQGYDPFSDRLSCGCCSCCGCECPLTCDKCGEEYHPFRQYDAHDHDENDDACKCCACAAKERE